MLIAAVMRTEERRRPIFGPAVYLWTLQLLIIAKHCNNNCSTVITIYIAIIASPAIGITQ